MPRARRPARERFTGLWRHPDFLKLWAGQTISLCGSQITLLALPLVAVLTLGASPLQLGLLRVFQTAPALLLGLFIGAWIDRSRRRPILLGADLGRAVVLGLIPLAAGLGLLRIEIVYAVGFLAGIMTVCFDVAYLSFLPSLVRREQLVDGNSKLETSFSVASIGGPGAPGASPGTGLDRPTLDSAYDGVVVNQTITMVGHDFYQAFVAAWRDKPLSERYTVTIGERPSPRLGSQVWVEFSRRRIFQSVLPPARARAAGIGEAAADIAYQSIVQSEVQQLLFREPDLAADEI